MLIGGRNLFKQALLIHACALKGGEDYTWEMHKLITNGRRLAYMKDLGWPVITYSDEEWQRFKLQEKELRMKHTNPEYH